MLQIDNSLIMLCLAGAALLLAFIAIIINISLRSKMKKFQDSYVSLQKMVSGNDLEQILRANLNEVKNISELASGHEIRLQSVESKLRKGIDRVEVVRFNSFEDMGSNLSFALALLNQEGTGVLLTGIHSREECRIYAKAVEQGQGATKMIDEEKEAVRKAMETLRI